MEAEQFSITLDDSSSTSSRSTKKHLGRKFSKVWEHFIQGRENTTRGHYEGTCKYCNKFWTDARPNILRIHLASHCSKCPNNISLEFARIVAQDSVQDESSNFKRQKTVRAHASSSSHKQTFINQHYETNVISKQRQKEIDNILVKTFILCNIAFSIIENPFFIELLKALCAGYNPPCRKRLSHELVEQELARVNIKILKIFDNTNNLTLALDGWTSPTGRSLWNFVILTPFRQEYLFCLQDLTEEHHTGEKLASEILKVLQSIGIRKFVAVVTDNGPNIKLARNLISTEFPTIFNIPCIAHYFNLISHDILKHSFAKKTIQYCNTLVTYFKKSHICGDLLEKLMAKYNILGGGLKTFVKTRWITMAECVNSILRLKNCFIEMFDIYNNEITSETVKIIINKRGFFNDVEVISKILDPIKKAILCLESNTSNLADCYIELLRIGMVFEKISASDYFFFKNFCIQKYNKRFKEFNGELYLLAFFLHPQFKGVGIPDNRFNEIVILAGNIWKGFGNNKKSCLELVSQLRDYKLKEPPYNAPYIKENDTPLKWWNTCFSNYNHLQTLAIKIFSITPNAASCERIWSTIGWMYGKRRTRMSITTIESLSKIHRYYITNIKDELRYYQPNISENNIIELVQESLSETYEEPVEDDEAIILSNLNEPEILSDNTGREVLDISTLFNLEPIVVVEYVDVSNFENRIETSRRNDDETDEEFDMEELVNNIL